MAIFKLFPTQDSTIYSESPYSNAGLDEILEIRNINNPINSVSRTLLKFNELADKISELNITGSYELGLKLYIASATSLKDNLEIIAHPITKSWSNGTGKWGDEYVNSDGVSWNNSDNGNQWGTLGGDFDTISVSQSLGINSSKDINMNLTPFIDYWLSNPNEGVILKLPNLIEFNPSTDIQPELRYFSSNTHTIYPPHIEIKWDDSIKETTTLSEVEDTDLYINLGNNKGEFLEGSINKFRVNVRPKFPKRKYQIKSIYTDNWILPEESCYAIKDLDTNEFIINFDENFTKLSCDTRGNFFILYMEGLQPERYYEVLIRSRINNEVIINSNKLYFKIKKSINE